MKFYLFGFICIDQEGWLNPGEYPDMPVPKEDPVRRRERGLRLQSFLKDYVLN